VQCHGRSPLGAHQRGTQYLPLIAPLEFAELLEGDLPVAVPVHRIEPAEGRLYELRAIQLAIAVQVGFGERFGRDGDAARDRSVP